MTASAYCRRRLACTAAVVSLAFPLAACSRDDQGDAGRPPVATGPQTTLAPARRPPCGKTTPLESVSPEVAPGARAGPIWFIAGGRPGKPATVILEPDYPTALHPTKVLIFLREPLTAPVTLRGWRCSDGKVLRFWYRDAPIPLASNPASPDELATAGEAVAKLEAIEPPIVSPTLGYPGYILFSAPGRWIVAVQRKGKTIGSSVFRIRT
jgi:hypothetical protein